MNEYEFKFDISVEKTVVVRGKDEDDALGTLYKHLESKGLDHNRMENLRRRQIEKKLNSESPSKMTN